MSQDKKTPGEAMDALTKKASRFSRLFSQGLGKKVLQDLEDEFNQDTIFQPGMPDATAYELGKRDVVVYINQLMRLHQNAARRAELEGQSSG